MILLAELPSDTHPRKHSARLERERGRGRQHRKKERQKERKTEKKESTERKEEKIPLLTFPPGKNSIELAARVSPGQGRRDTLSTMSWLIDPTTRRGRGCWVEGEEEVGGVAVVAEAATACALAVVNGIVFLGTRARAQLRSMRERCCDALGATRKRGSGKRGAGERW